MNTNTTFSIMIRNLPFCFFFFLSFNLFSQPDLAIDLTYLKNTTKICEGEGLDCFMHTPLLGSPENTQPCDVEEGCTQAGVRKLLRFGLRQINVGDKDFDLGRVKGNNKKPYFSYAPCHDHYHFSGFSRFELYDLNCNLVIPAGKSGGCMFNFDYDILNGMINPSGCQSLRFQFCDIRQGISKGCADIYDPTLACQYVDITGQPNGKYFLKVTINWDQALIATHSNLQEASYTNNTAYILVDIQGNNVTVLYAEHTIPNDISLANLDLLPAILQNAIKNKRTLIARQTITTGPNTTLNDNKQRDLIAGNKITFFPGTIIAPQPGGKLVAQIDPCLSTASFKTSNDGDFFASIDSSLTITAEEYVKLDDEENSEDIIPSNIVSENILLFPNPTAGQFTLSINSNNDFRSDIFVYDAFGKLVFRAKNVTNPTLNIDISGQSSGIYLVRVQKGKEQFLKKIVVQ